LWSPAFRGREWIETWLPASGGRTRPPVSPRSGEGSGLKPAQ